MSVRNILQRQRFFAFLSSYVTTAAADATSICSRPPPLQTVLLSISPSQNKFYAASAEEKA